MSVSTQTYSFCDHHIVELEAPPAAAGECRARIRSTPAETAAGQALERWEGEAGHARSSSSCFGRGDLAAGAGLAARPPASEAGAPEWQSSPCTPRLQRAASDALGDASGLACAPCAALADKPADQPAAGAGDGGVIVPHAQAAALGAAGVVNGCECSCRAGTRPCRDAAGRAACACHSQGEWGLVTRRYRDAAEPPLLGLPCQAPPAAVQLAAALWAPAAAAAGLATNSVEEGRVALQCAAVAAPARPAQGARLCDSWPEAAMLAGAAAASARPEPPAAAEPAPAPAGSVAGGSRWADELPDDLLRGVLGRMPPAYLRVARLVCRGWAAAAGRLMSRLQPERLQGGRLAARFPHLRALCLSHCGHRVVAIERHKLRLQSTLGDGAMAQVAQLTGLTQLSLRGCAGLTGAPGAGFECLRALGALRSLNLSQCDALQDGALETVAALTALTSLSLRGCSALSDAAPARLAPLAQLRHLALGGPAVSDAGLVHCIVLTALEHVCLASCRRVTDVGMAVLTALPALRRVTLSRCPTVSEAGLKLLLARTHLACTPAPLGGPRTFELIFTVLHNADVRLALPAFTVAN